jgi:pimeloyl-ACP methyl ester carboxylesterase
LTKVPAGLAIRHGRSCTPDLKVRGYGYGYGYLLLATCYLLLEMFDLGSGPPLVLIPGIQGRWEWMETTARALAPRFRVLMSSLAGEPGSGVAPGEGQTFEVQARIVRQMLDVRGLERCTLVGVSFGGLVASYVAATMHERVERLVLVSTPGPDWEPDTWARRYMKAPVLMAPVFVLGAPWRLGPEFLSATSTPAELLRVIARQAGPVFRAPMRPWLMGERLRVMAAIRSRGWSGSIVAPTLVVTGEPHLDKVIDVAGSRRYAEVIAGSALITMRRTGHIGCVTQPEPFARLVESFCDGTLPSQGSC